MRPIPCALLVASISALFAPHSVCEDGSALTVIAAGPEGDAITDVRVSCWTQKGGRWLRQAETITDAEGRTRFAPPPLPYTLLAASAGWVPVRLDVTQTRASLRLVLERGRNVSVKAHRKGSLEPIARFRVLPLSDDALQSTSQTQAFALETVDALESDEESGVANVGGLDQRVRMLLILAQGSAPAFVPLPGPGKAEIDVELDSGGCAEYRVVDRQGAPIIGARAALSADLLGSWESRLALVPQSGELGYITLCRAGAGTAPVLVAHPDHAARLWAWNSAGTEIELGSGGTVVGQVMDSDGLPLRGGAITITALGLAQSARTTEDGRFELSHLPPGEWSVTVSDERLPTALRANVKVIEDEVTSMHFGPSPLLTVQILENERVLEQGRLLLLIGKTASELDVAADTAVVRGEASLPFDDNQESWLLALRRGDAVVFGRLAKPVKPARHEAQLQWSLTGQTLRGEVLAAGSHRPLSGAQVICQRGVRSFLSAQSGPLWFDGLAAQPLFEGDASLAVSGKNGKFEFFLPDWCTSLQLVGPRANSTEEDAWQSRSIEASTIDRSKPLSVGLSRAATVRARVVTEAGISVRDVSLALFRAGRSSSTSSRSVALSELVRLELPDRGPWWLVATAEGVAPAVLGPLEVGAEENAVQREPYELRLESGGFIDVPRATRPQVLDRAGNDWAVWASSQDLDAAMRRLGPLPRGSYRVVDGERSKTVTLREAGQVLRVFGD